MTSASGSLSLAQTNLATLLANCTAWRTLTGAGDAAEGLGHIWHDALPPPADAHEHALNELETYRPFALISTPPNDGFETEVIAGGVGLSYTEGGQLEVIIEADVPEDIRTNPAEVMLRFRNHIGDIIDDLRSLAGPGGTAYLNVSKLMVTEGPYRSNEEQYEKEGDFQTVTLLIEWEQ